MSAGSTDHDGKARLCGLCSNYIYKFKNSKVQKVLDL
jgi:hypothetical protein